MHPRELPPCDLVMKGGVTSGVVYPGAVLELSGRYRFEKVGGASAGAVAAAMAAAAEFARQRSGKMELPGVQPVVQQLKTPGLVPSLFEPARPARPLFALALAVMARRRSHWRQTGALASAAIRHRPIHAIGAAICAGGIVALLAAAFRNLSLVPAVVLAVLGTLVLMVLAAWAVLGPLVSMGRAAWRLLPAQGFGLCPGVKAGPGDPDSLTDWMHGAIQRCAELPPEQPLTFAMLEQQGIGLQMAGTDLGLARPVTIPFTPEQYLFSPAELGALFPRPVVDHVLSVAGVPESERDSARTWFLPAKDLPVVIGARLSSSVPLLLSSLKLYSARPEAGGPIESYISDGGITSNFPIHFFDDWLPSHPTFGLDLVPVGADHPGPDVYIPRADEPAPAVRAGSVGTLTGFLRQIEDASRNWRDQLQAELPGNRDRICEIRMRAGEGGFNLDADPQIVERLMERGRAAGREILDKFDWDRHRALRYVLVMDLLEDNLALLGERFGSYREWLRRAGAERAAALIGRDAAWVSAAERATADLIAHAPSQLPGTEEREVRQPEPTMRIGPRV